MRSRDFDTGGLGGDMILEQVKVQNRGREGRIDEKQGSTEIREKGVVRITVMRRMNRECRVVMVYRRSVE